MSITSKDRPISEEFRLIAKQWVDADAAARLLEETKTTVLNQRMKALGDMAVNAAEREVKSSPEWHEFIKELVDARTKANLLKCQMEYIRMKFNEWQALDANSRAEMRLTR
jgi:hypothetical protein